MTKRTKPIPDLHAAYRAMAADHEREAEALEWAEAMIADGNAQEDIGEPVVNSSCHHGSKSS